MKKLVTGLSGILLTSVLTLGHHEADAAITKPSQLKDGVQTYQAVVIKDTKAYDMRNFKRYTLKKGTNIKIVEKIDYETYHLLTLEGENYIRVNDKTVKIIKPLKGKTNYHAFKISATSKKYLKELGKNHKDYKNYKNFLIHHDAEIYYETSQLIGMTLDMNLYTNKIYGVGLNATGPSDYKYWKSIGKPVYDTTIEKTWITQ